jgi:hypothetical protein
MLRCTLNVDDGNRLRQVDLPRQVQLCWNHTNVLRLRYAAPVMFNYSSKYFGVAICTIDNRAQLIMRQEQAQKDIITTNAYHDPWDLFSPHSHRIA